MSDTNTVSPLRQRMIEDMAARKLNPHTRCQNAYWAPPISCSCRHAGRILPASRLPSRSALTSNPHSTRCPASAQLPATSCLGAFWTPVS